MNKKGVSPLIATVLLIAFSVALGAVVMNWGTSYVRNTSEASETNSDDKVMCSTGVDVEFTEINGIKLVKYEAFVDEVNFSVGVRNTGSQDISGFYVSMLGNSSLQSTKVDSGASVGTGLSKTFIAQFSSVTPADYYDGDGKIVGLEVVPYTTVNGREVICAGKSIKLASVEAK